jgi:hypothetical protein
MIFIRNITYILIPNIIRKKTKDLNIVKYSKDNITFNNSRILIKKNTFQKKYEMVESHSTKPYTVFKIPK